MKFRYTFISEYKNMCKKEHISSFLKLQYELRFFLHTKIYNN